MTTPAQHLVQVLAGLPPAATPDKLAIYISAMQPAAPTPRTPASMVIDILNDALVPTLVIDVLANRYEAGPPETGTYEAGPPEFPSVPVPGRYQVGPSDVSVPWGFGISILTALGTPYVPGVGAATLVLDMMEQVYIAETFPPPASMVISIMGRGLRSSIGISVLTQSYFVDADLDERGRYEAGPPDLLFAGERLEPEPGYWVDNIFVNTPDETRMDLMLLDEAILQ